MRKGGSKCNPKREEQTPKQIITKKSHSQGGGGENFFDTRWDIFSEADPPRGGGYKTKWVLLSFLPMLHTPHNHSVPTA